MSEEALASERNSTVAMPATGTGGTEPSLLDASAMARVAPDENSTGASPIRAAR